MELVGKLKDSVSKAKDKEEAKGIIEKAGMKLTDEELDMVSGGVDLQIVLPEKLKQGDKQPSFFMAWR